MEAVCSTCQKPKAAYACGLCTSAVCKKCAQFVTKDTFEYLENKPAELSHDTYCPRCFNEKVSAALFDYEATVEKAKGVFVFHLTQREKEATRFYSRGEKPIKIDNGTDKDEVLMRLAFQAAQRGFNCLLDVSVVPNKVRNFGYQTTAWVGTGIPTKVDAEALERKDKKR